LERSEFDDMNEMTSAIVAGYIRRLRHQLGEKQPQEEVRAKTRERVRRFRERQVCPACQ
jgi:hypothetical protein